ncbi:MAG: InlB B-repeat-containing protein, partial [Paludibacteraceae bacterium]
NSQTQTSGSVSVAQTCIITVTATPAEGYTLESLTIDGKSFNSGGTHIVRASTTIAATFRKNTPVYTVRFHANGHGNDPAAQQVEKNMCAVKPEMAAVKWYELEGWYTDEACTERWMFEEPVTRDMDLYANWIGGNYPTMAVLASFLNWDEGGAQKMTKSEDGKTASYTHTFTKAVEDEQFGLRESNNEYTDKVNQADWWAFDKSGAHTTITESTTVPLYNENTKGEGSATNIKITVSEPQEVTFTFDYVRKTLTVSYASDNQNKYRLVYMESAGGVTQVFHPSHTIAAAEDARMDTVSLYVKPYERKASGSNTNSCYVLLQQMTDGKVWAEKQRIDVKEQTSIFTTNGVYNFVLVQDGRGASLPVEKVHPYSGNYYIRLGLDRDYRSSEKVFRFSDYASKYDARFDHYFCKYVEGSDVRFCVACDYSACVSDTLAQEPDGDPHHDYTDANGKLLHNANVRFMWNSENNHIDRAYLAGAGSNVILLSRSGISTTQGGAAQTEVVLADAQNWVYQHDVYAAVGTRVKLRVKPHNDAQESDYLYLKGKKGQDENDFSDENTVELIGGSQEKILKVRVIYDFKSNHLICAWLPEQSYTIEGELSLNSDLILIRKEHNDAQQITFKGDNAQITKVSQAYGVLSLSRSHFGNKNVSDNAKKFYWISFPFDVHLSEVFSALTYGKDYVLKYYDGVERAEKGCWKDSPSFWKMYRSTEDIKLKKGKGYLLHVNISDTASFFAKGNTEVNIYFPSANTDSMTISGKIDSTAVPQHPCTIQRDHRNIYDSNWNLIGVPSWANVDQMGLPKATEINGISVKFLYEYDPENNGYNPVESGTYDFGSMKAYMVQFAGTIKWKEKSITPSQKPLRAPAAANEQTIRLDLLRGEERLDHTFVQLSDNEDITEGFDLNSDLTKVHNHGCNLYTLIGSEQIEAAANILPMSERTIYVPVGVSVDSDGTYTFALPEEMEGMDVRIADAETGYTHNLLFSPYEVSLTAGSHTQRFSLEIHASSQVTTGCSETDAAGERLRKVLLNGQLLLQTGERLYDAQGKRLW